MMASFSFSCVWCQLGAYRHCLHWAATDNIHNNTREQKALLVLVGTLLGKQVRLNLIISSDVFHAYHSGVLRAGSCWWDGPKQLDAGRSGEG